ERGVMLKRGAEERLAGQEANDELGRGRKMRPIRLAREIRHVLANVARVRLHERGTRVVGESRRRVEKRLERRFRVDDQVPTAREPNREIGTQSATITRQLLIEVAMLEHPGQLHHALELHLTSPAADLRRT